MGAQDGQYPRADKLQVCQFSVVLKPVAHHGVWKVMIGPVYDKGYPLEVKGNDGRGAGLGEGGESACGPSYVHDHGAGSQKAA